VSEKKKGITTPTPWSWVKNTYFWIAFALFALGIAGLIRGGDYIRDPGQLEKVQLDIPGISTVITNTHLPMIYLLSSIVMLVNGVISHKVWLRQMQEEN
jgi:hypothetical protein